MMVATPDDAREWLKAWGGAPPAGVLAEALRGQRMRLGIARGNPARYGAEAVRTNEETIAVLEGGGR